MEEAELLERLYHRHRKVVVRLSIKSKQLGKTTSRNTVFEILGSEYPNEIILLSGHIDSWDVGQGALDDGGGLAAVWQAMKAIQELGKRDVAFVPKRFLGKMNSAHSFFRTIRGVFFTAEEQGFLGSRAYYNAHNGSIPEDESFFFVSETDQGAFRPTTSKSMLAFMGEEKHVS